MNIDIKNDLEYKDLLFEVFTTYDIPTLQQYKSELNLLIDKPTEHGTMVRIGRLIYLIDSYINILNIDLTKYN